MLLSWVSVIIPGELKWKRLPLSALAWVLKDSTEINTKIHVLNKAARSDCNIENDDSPDVYYDSTWFCADI